MSERASRFGPSASTRVEDAALLCGRGQFADDLGCKPGTLHAAILRSSHAHARLRSVDVAAAERALGVRAVLTAEDTLRWSRPLLAALRVPVLQPVLAKDAVHYVGEPLAVVLAENRYLAEDALDAIRVEYEPRPPVLDIVQALALDGPRAHVELTQNVVSDRSYCYGDPDAAFAAASHRVRLQMSYPRNIATPLECGVVVAEHFPDGNGGHGAYEVMSNFTGPMSLHAVMAMALQVPESHLRLRFPRDVGGSFGTKQSLFSAIVLLCLAARKAGAPVKWVEDRREHMTASTSATARLSHIEAAVQDDGRIAALSFDQIDDVGAYLRAPEPATFYRMHGCLTGAYAIQHLRVRNRVVLTNKTPTGLVRGFGGPQVYFALERLVQRIAVRLGLDPLDVYRRNFIAKEAFPYRAAAGALIDSGDYAATLAEALQAADITALRDRQRQLRSEGRLYGIGFSAVVEPSISNMGYVTAALTAAQREHAGPKQGALAAATVQIDPLGGITVGIDSMPAGQGHRTVCAQLVAAVFGLTAGEVVVNSELDTQKDAWSIAAGNYSCRFSGAVAGAVQIAAQRLRDRIAQRCADLLGCAPPEVVFAAGSIHARGTPKHALPLARVLSGPHWAPALSTEAGPPPLRETVFFTPETLHAPSPDDRVNASATYGFVFDLCALEIDRTTGRICIERYVTAHDAGRLLHPALADGQVRGGFAQALGAALSEELRYDGQGRFVSQTLSEYLLPTCLDVPAPIIVHTQTPSPYTPLGAKGIGEGNSMSTPVCIANAVADALSSLPQSECCQDLRLPLTPATLLALVARGQGKVAGGTATVQTGKTP